MIKIKGITVEESHVYFPSHKSLKFLCQQKLETLGKKLYKQQELVIRDHDSIILLIDVAKNSSNWIPAEQAERIVLSLLGNDYSLYSLLTKFLMDKWFFSVGDTPCIN